MTVCGIVAEYNPFHTGHAHHIAQTRRALGGEAAIVCAMSGNFVQRGDFAVLDKYARAEMAVRGGADLVVELPLAAALSSAEGFARGAIGVLRALGCGVVSFGAETPDTALIERAARALDALPPTGGGASPLSYAARRQDELRRLDERAAALLDTPNNTLAVEYCRAMLPYGMRPLAVARRGAAHDADAPCAGFASASLLRARLRAGETARCAPYLLPDTLAIWQHAVQAGAAPVNLPEDTLLALLRAAIGLPADAPVRPQHLRVLALGPAGRRLLRGLPDRPPVIIKPVSEKRLPAALQPALALDCFADDLYALACPSPALRAGGSHYRQTPFYLPHG